MNKSAPMEYEKAIEYIDQMIRDGELVTGSRLPTERTISEHLGIGRNSTREALSILHGMGMIRRVQGSGNYVTGDAHRAIRQICTMMLALGTITKKDVCEFRRVLEKSACLLLSEKGVPADERRQFEEILAAMESADEKNRLQAYHKGIYTSLSEADTDLALRFVDDHYDLIEEMLEL